MTHQVLARKWRPQTFADVSGQTHVVRALSNALAQHRLHHAYLLTGTRGVGKTSLARILAKCLNCEKGISNTPCLTCSHCQAIEQNQFIDLIEIDAASRTRVEDTRELLDNVQYMPTIGRYKVYLIDEVHMLSNHSFNALLKTLEEPPAHVIFILATTDPERLPVTVRSRCLHFQLKAMSPEQITQRLAVILEAEQLKYTTAALAAIAHAAQGSMRDALSLLDQVIALGQGDVTEQAAFDLLGGINTEGILALLRSLTNNEGKALLETSQRWLSEGVDFQLALDAIIDNLHQISLLQVIPDANEFDSCHAMRQALASDLQKEQVQLYYQIALYGKRDLAYAPTPRLGFEMTLLRMLAFSPAKSIDAPKIIANLNLESPPVQIASATIPAIIAAPEEPPSTAPILSSQEPSTIVSVNPIDTPSTIRPLIDWPVLITQLQLKGPSKLLAESCVLKQYDNETGIILELDPKQQPMLTQLSQEKLTQAISIYFAKSICVKIEIGRSGLASPANLVQQREAAALHQAEQSLLNDPGLQSLLHRFDAAIEPGSIQPKIYEETSK
ncbi:MAG: DNA polymerase III subunit gamma/tau [Gammaproteobacteria bacterium]|nr:DNA polymerase III subunit gamma/tau [Gammaproteobacteria bacterium]